ncbi:MAG: GNAT family N-acetyltransferase [Anaerolineales bacterium]|nr:GNAT family N-acetyltransferase [Anaerolineales bacterium]
MLNSIETPRLTLRRFQDADVAALAAYRNDPEVARYQSWESISLARAQAFVQEQRDLAPGLPGEWFHFAIVLRETGQLIGDVGLNVLVQDVRQAQLGLTLDRAYQGQGLGGEAATAALDYAFINLDLHRVMAVVDVLNTPAVALLERIGLRREGHFLKNAWFKGRWADEYLYALLQAEWLPRRGLPGAR